MLIADVWTILCRIFAFVFRYFQCAEPDWLVPMQAVGPVHGLDVCSARGIVQQPWLPIIIQQRGLHTHKQITAQRTHTDTFASKMLNAIHSHTHMCNCAHIDGAHCNSIFRLVDCVPNTIHTH